MSQIPAAVQSLAELETRQDELLRQLDELEVRIATALTEFAVLKQEACKPRRTDRPAQAA